MLGRKPTKITLTADDVVEYEMREAARRAMRQARKEAGREVLNLPERALRRHLAKIEKAREEEEKRVADQMAQSEQEQDTHDAVQQEQHAEAPEQQAQRQEATGQ